MEDRRRFEGPRRATGWVLACGLAIGSLGAGAGRAAAAQPPFRWVEATISDIRTGFASRTLDCRTLVQGYLDRIAAYDRVGPALQSVLAVAPGAMAEAERLDEVYEASGPVGPLHCVPVLLKDNIDTHDMATTGGAIALENARPPDDAHLAARLRAEGALILGKTNMDEFAFGFAGSSSLGGQVRNPYDPERGPGGSSSGTGAAVAASLAAAGVGTDTGGSIRVPSSVQGLVGIRPSLRLVSQDGVMPLARFQDTAGPMCRAVEDCALLLEAMVGFDPGPFSGQNRDAFMRDDEAVRMASEADYRSKTGATSGIYVGALDRDGLAGARVGVVRALFGTNPQVISALNRALDRMRAAGAAVEDVTIPDLSSITSYASVSRWEFRDHLTSYLSSWPSDRDGHKRTFEEVAASLGYEQGRIPTFLAYGLDGTTRYVQPDYERNTKDRSAFVRPRLLAALENTDLQGTQHGEPYDVLLYPAVLGPPAVGGPPPTGSNNRLSPFGGLPALTMPAGFTSASGSVPALPIGMELLGREFAEATLIRIAFAYQEAAEGTALGRRPPTFTPELD